MKIFSFLIIFLLLPAISSFDLNDLTSEQALTISGNTATSYYFGRSVSNAGDINQDGYDDIIIGSFYENTNQGKVYIIYGSSSSYSDIDLSTTTLNPKTTGFTITGNAQYDCFGYSVSTAGDINKDGYDDIIIGAYNKSSVTGAAYIIYGRSTSLLANIDLENEDLDPATTGLVLYGGTTEDAFGFSVSTAGDVNNDGYADIIIGAYCRNSQQGAAYIYYGEETSTIEASQTLSSYTVITGADQGDNFGYSVGNAGDINGDSFDDVVIGALQAAGSGIVYVIYGASSLTAIDLESDPLSAHLTGFVVGGPAQSSMFGFSVSTAGDVNNDGYDDIICGAYGANTEAGVVYVILGKSNGALANINLSTAGSIASTSTGFYVKGNAQGDHLGISVGNAGDINNDGYDDIIFGTDVKNNSAGAVYVVYGKPTAQIESINLASISLDPESTGFIVAGKTAGDHFGFSASTAGDFNGDNKTDLIIGAFNVDNSIGAVYILFPSKMCTDNCESCSTLLTCETCSDGYVLKNSQCQACSSGQYTSNNKCTSCPKECSKCTSASSCQTCSEGYGMVDSQCVICPDKTYLSNSKCLDYSTGCLECTSQSVCSLCSDDYTLSQTTHLCTDQSLTSTQQKASSAAFEGASSLGSALSSGSSLPINFGLVAKLLKNLKYLDVTVSSELQEAFSTWKVSSSFIAAPSSWSEKYQSKALPTVFSQYGLEPIFIINYWKPLIMTLAGFILFVLFKLMEISFSKRRKWSSTLRAFNVIASNFALTQFYSSLDDIIFYFVLEARSIEFGTVFRDFSFTLAIILILIGFTVLGFHGFFLSKYQAVKKAKTNFQDFLKKYENIKLFFQDFKDDTLFTQSFLLLHLARCLISSILFTNFFDYPLVQTSFLTSFSIFMTTYVAIKRPFSQSLDTIGQLFCEVILLLANISMLIMAIFDQVDYQPETSVDYLSKSVIILNLIMLLGCIIFMVFGIFKTFYKIYKEKKKVKSIPNLANKRSIPIIQQNQENLESTMTPMKTDSSVRNIAETHDLTMIETPKQPNQIPRRPRRKLPGQNEIITLDTSSGNLLSNNTSMNAEEISPPIRGNIRSRSKHSQGLIKKVQIPNERVSRLPQKMNKEIQEMGTIEGRYPGVSRGNTNMMKKESSETIGVGGEFTGIRNANVNVTKKNNNKYEEFMLQRAREKRSNFEARNIPYYK